MADKEKSTRIQLAYDSPFRFEKPLDPDIGVKGNDYKDLIVDKLRDAIDLFFILKTEDLMVREVNVNELKNLFLDLSRKIMDKISV